MNNERKIEDLEEAVRNEKSLTRDSKVDLDKINKRIRTLEVEI